MNSTSMMPPRVVLEGEAGLAVQGVRVVHFLAHGDDVFLQASQVARQTQDLDADSPRNAGRPPDHRHRNGRGSGLVFPGQAFFN